MKRSIQILVSVSVFLIAFVVVFLFWQNVRAPETSIFINGRKINVEIADTQERRDAGLSGYKELLENEGMLFLFQESGRYGFWMKDMKFPIDIIWILDDTIIGIDENIDPQIGLSISDLNVYYPSEPVNKVLELKAGMAESIGMKVSDKISFSSE